MILTNSNESKETERRRLSDVFEWIKSTGFAEDYEMVDAKTPIIRMKCKKTNIRVDLCLTSDVSGKGRESTNKFQNILERLPTLRPVIILIKYLLRQRSLNETYTGGIGSYLLLNMIYAYAQYLRKKGEIEKVFNHGQFFLGFLKFYGEEFNYKDLGISINEGGEFFKKRDRPYPFNPNLCFENYQDPDIDIGKPAFQFLRIRNLFKEILYTLYKVKCNTESFLIYFINVTSEMKKYASSVSKSDTNLSNILLEENSVYNIHNTSNTSNSSNSITSNINNLKLD